VLSFADLTFKRVTSSSEEDGSSSIYTVGAVDPSRQITHHVVLITHPGDGRYGPLQAGQLPTTAAAADSAGGSNNDDDSSSGLAVRVLVAPLALGGNGSAVPGEAWVVAVCVLRCTIVLRVTRPLSIHEPALRRHARTCTRRCHCPAAALELPATVRVQQQQPWQELRQPQHAAGRHRSSSSSSTISSRTQQPQRS
jgi:hypothetical protein